MSAFADTLKTAGGALEIADDFQAVNEAYIERGWSDGLPIVPPTIERVEAMLAWCDRPWHEPVAKIPPRWGEATPVRLAANAVMAGCLPEYFPLFLLAIEALCTEKFNLYGLQTTTHLCAPLLVVNGPVARELDINAGHNAFGPGWRSNATIGRAIRLALLNIGGGKPGSGDMATFGSPAKYSYCIAENEAKNPWQPLHVERGYPVEASTVSVFAAEAPHNINDHESISGAGILKMIANSVAITGSHNVLLPGGEALIVLGPEHAATIARDGYSKSDVQRMLYENTQVPFHRFSDEYVEKRMKRLYPERWSQDGLEARAPVVNRPEDFVIIVTGGAGKHSAFIPTRGHVPGVTRPLVLRDGSYARSVRDFRKSQPT